MIKRIILFSIIIIFISILILSCAHITIPALNKKINTEEIAVAEEYYKKAIDSEKNGDIYHALLFLKLAMDKNPNNKKISSKYNSIIKSLSSEITGTQEVVKKGSSIVNPIIFKLYMSSGGKLIPVQGMPVHFKLINASGKITEKGITNDIGEAKCYVDRIEEYTDSITIEAYVTIPDNEKGKRIDKLTKRFVFTNISILDRQIKILLKSDSSLIENQTLESIPQNITNVLNEEGFDDVSIMPSFNTQLFDNAVKLDRNAIQKLGVESASDILLLISINEPLNLQQSFDFYLKKILIKIIIADTKSGNIYIKEVAEGKGADRTEKEAENKAIENAYSKLKDILRNYLEEVKTKNEFFKLSAESKSISISS